LSQPGHDTPDAQRPTADAFVVSVGFEAALGAELGDDWSAGDAAVSGLVVAERRPGADGAVRDLIFARQRMPAAVEVRAPSVQRLAEAAYQATSAAVDAGDAPFTLHAWPAVADPMLGSRVELVGRQLLDLLKARRRRAFRAYRAPEEIGEQWAPGARLVQLVALERERLLVSAAVARALPRGGTDLAPWPAGNAPIALDKAPPSRAYQKLEEAFAWLGTAPTAGQTCVDLGGAPGGWALTALKRGARVTAIDRAPLEPPAAGHPRLTAMIGNAFTFEPPKPVDWLLCDVVCEPARTLELIARWLDQRWCRRMVVTIKFKGRAGYGVLSEVEPLFVAAGWRFARTKQLLHNKNEVTVLGKS
jgi:23S rRNA (cytidine2498-2'-O)-methyltransferase